MAVLEARIPAVTAAVTAVLVVTEMGVHHLMAAEVELRAIPVTAGGAKMVPAGFLALVLLQVAAQAAGLHISEVVLLRAPLAQVVV